MITLGWDICLFVAMLVAFAVTGDFGWFWGAIGLLAGVKLLSALD